jgi:hypothetical protein
MVFIALEPTMKTISPGMDLCPIGNVGHNLPGHVPGGTKKKSGCLRDSRKVIGEAGGRVERDGGYLTPSKASMMPPEMAVPKTPARLGPMAW